MAEVLKFDTNLIGECKSLILSETDYFNNTVFDTYTSSYIIGSSDYHVSSIANQLTKIYNELKKGYSSISSWIEEYETDVLQTEQNLVSRASDFSNVSTSSNASVKNALLSLPLLSIYKVDSIKYGSSNITTNSTFVNNASSVENLKKSFESNYSNEFNDYRQHLVSSLINIPGFSNISDYIDIIEAETGATFSPEVLSSYNSSINTDEVSISAAELHAAGMSGALNSISSQALVYTSLVEGVLVLGEALVDTCAIVGTALGSIGTGVYDLFTGGTATADMWDATTGFVAEKHVTGWFDYIYDETAYGDFITENAFFGNEDWQEVARNVGVGIGYVGGIAATAGIAGAAAGVGGATSTTMAITAGTAGFGAGAEEAWASGASVVEGLTAGALNAAWEAGQMFVGAKIGASTKISLPFKIASETVTGGLEGIVRPAINTVYADGYYNDNNEYVEFDANANYLDKYAEVFDDNGGVQSILTNAVVGTAFGALGETTDLFKAIRKNDAASSIKIDINVNSANATNLLSEYKKALEVVDTIEYKMYAKELDAGHGVVYNELFSEWYAKFPTLEKQFNEIDLNNLTPSAKAEIDGFKLDLFKQAESKNATAILEEYKGALEVVDTREYQMYVKNIDAGHGVVYNETFSYWYAKFPALEKQFNAINPDNLTPSAKAEIDDFKLDLFKQAESKNIPALLEEYKNVLEVINTREYQMYSAAIDSGQSIVYDEVFGPIYSRLPALEKQFNAINLDNLTSEAKNEVILFKKVFLMNADSLKNGVNYNVAYDNQFFAQIDKLSKNISYIKEPGFLKYMSDIITSATMDLNDKISDIYYKDILNDYTNMKQTFLDVDKTKISAATRQELDKLYSEYSEFLNNLINKENLSTAELTILVKEYDDFHKTFNSGADNNIYLDNDNYYYNLYAEHSLEIMERFSDVSFSNIVADYRSNSFLVDYIYNYKSQQIGSLNLFKDVINNNPQYSSFFFDRLGAERSLLLIEQLPEDYQTSYFANLTITQKAEYFKNLGTDIDQFRVIPFLSENDFVDLIDMNVVVGIPRTLKIEPFVFNGKNYDSKVFNTVDIINSVRNGDDLMDNILKDRSSLYAYADVKKTLDAAGIDLFNGVDNGFLDKADNIITELRQEALDDYKSWVDNVSVPVLKDMFSKYVSPEKFSSIGFNNAKFLTDMEFKREFQLKHPFHPFLERLDYLNGFNNAKFGNVMNINRGFDETKTTVIHEFIHDISRASASVSGLHIKSEYLNFNEAATQMLTQFVMTQGLHTQYASTGYDGMTFYLNELVNLNIPNLDADSFFTYYFSNDIASVRNIIDGYMGANYFDNTLMPSFDKASTGSLIVLEREINRIADVVNSYR